MKETLRQSMAWLHTWGGLLTGWVLFFVFLTGTFGYVNYEVDRWMKPELPLASDVATPQLGLGVAETWLQAHASNAESWFITLPGGRQGTGLSAAWRERPLGDERYGKYTNETLDPATGEIVSGQMRETGGGQTLYRMHYELHYLPYDWAVRIVGICTMFMLIAILSGIVTHKKIFKDFFTFRPRKGQRSWLDGHNLVSVTALPFHLMITWSGLVLFLFTYMPVAVDVLYPEGEARDAFYAKAYGYEARQPNIVQPAAPTLPLAPLLEKAQSTMGDKHIWRVNVDNPGRADSRVTFYSSEGGIGRGGSSVRFDGVNGERLSGPNDRQTSVGAFADILTGLHEGRFAGVVLRLLYIIAGLSGTAMIATGLLLWSAKRKARLEKAGQRHFGIAAVDILNLGTIIGLPIGIAAYFWANRLIPTGIEGRGAWEIHSMFIAWGLTFLWAIWRPLDRAWLELCGLAAAACGLIPILNALTTSRHLGITVPAGDWVLAGFDLFAFGAGLFFLFLARTLRRKQSARPPARETIIDESAAPVVPAQ